MNRTNFRLAASIALLLGPAAALAQFDIGGRLGIGYAGGEYGLPANGALSSDLDESLALGIDGAYNFAPGIKVGAYVNYLRPRFDNGRAQGIGSATSYGLKASVNDIQLGLRVEAVMGDAKLAGYTARPWGALFGGWEKLWFSYDATRTSGAGPASLSPSRSFTGWTGGLEGGIEVTVSHKFSAGPFLAFGMGKFGAFSGSGTGAAPTAGTPNTWADDSFAIPDRYQALHTWTTLGLRGRFSL
jgi:hypothetical protein